MNSLVVLFSVMALAAAQPQWAAVAPAVAFAPAAISQQSRTDVKSTPAVVKTDVIAPAIAPAVLAAPVAYSAPIAIAPAAVSSQSQIDIKSSLGLISTIAGAPLTYTAPLTFGAPSLAFGAQIAYGAPIAAAFTPSIYTPAIASVIDPALLKTAKPEADLAPAASNDAAPPLSTPLSDYVPTETPEVAAARAAHLQAKALEESHQIQKRSVRIAAASPVVSSYTSPILTSYASSPVIYSSPITRIAPFGLAAPFLPAAYGTHPYYVPSQKRDIFSVQL